MRRVTHFFARVHKDDIACVTAFAGALIGTSVGLKDAIDKQDGMLWRPIFSGGCGGLIGAISGLYWRPVLCMAILYDLGCSMAAPPSFEQRSIWKK